MAHPWLRKQEQLVLAGCSGAIALLGYLIFFQLPPHGVDYWEIPRDDFYYYLKVAQNLSSGHGSTFNGIVPTNGYHPLFLLLITLICRFSSSLDHVLSTVWVLTIALSVVTFLVLYRIFRQFSRSMLLCVAAAVSLSIACLDMYRDGMEVTLALPLALFGILNLVRDGEWTVGRCFATGLLASLMVLARIDSGLLVLLVALVFLPTEYSAVRRHVAKTIALIAGMFPVAVYLLINVLSFHTLLPVSAKAKEQRLTHAPSARAIESAYSLTRYEHRHWVPAFFALAGLLLIGVAWREQDPRRRALLVALLAFPWVHLMLLTFLSDWFLWSWYLYPFNLAAVAGLCLLLQSNTAHERIGFARLAAACVLLIAAVESQQMLRARVSGEAPHVRNGLLLAQFAADHPGRYAMGDMAGFAGVVVPEPIVQTEGLVMDPAFLLRMRNQRNLVDVLRSYGVRYYVSTVQSSAVRPAGLKASCFEAVEPIQAGPTSIHMQAKLCSPPLATYHVAHWTTRIYDLATLPTGVPTN